MATFLTATYWPVRQPGSDALPYSAFVDAYIGAVHSPRITFRREGIFNSSFDRTVI
jgi:hypothetical protein